MNFCARITAQQLINQAGNDAVKLIACMNTFTHPCYAYAHIYTQNDECRDSI